MDTMPPARPASPPPANLIIAKLALHLACVGLIIAAVWMQDRYGISCAKAQRYSFLDNFSAILAVNQLLAANRSLVVSAAGAILILNLLINHRLTTQLLLALALLLCARQAQTYQRAVAERQGAFCGPAPSMGLASPHII